MVVVDGRSQGITNKNRHTDAAKSPVSRVKIASEFIRLVQLLETKVCSGLMTDTFSFCYLK